MSRTFVPFLFLPSTPTPVIPCPRVNPGARSHATQTSKHFTRNRPYSLSIFVCASESYNEARMSSPITSTHGPPKITFSLISFSSINFSQPSSVVPGWHHTAGTFSSLAALRTSMVTWRIGDQTIPCEMGRSCHTLAGVTTLTDVWLGSLSPCKDLIVASPCSSASFCSPGSTQLSSVINSVHHIPGERGPHP